jgi:hypothetical protein
MQAYCVKCRAKKKMRNPENITMKNGRSATQGTCPTCGTKMFRIGKSKKVTREEARKIKVKVPSTLTRYGENPIISPREGSWWESRQTFNPGAIYLEDKVHLLYRAIGMMEFLVLATRFPKKASKLKRGWNIQCINIRSPLLRLLFILMPLAAVLGEAKTPAL